MIKAVSILSFPIAVANLVRLNSLNKRIGENSSNVNKVMEFVNSINIDSRLDYIEDLLGSNITGLLTNLESLDLALNEVDVLNIIRELQEAKIEAVKAIELAESAFNFFNAPVELTNYISITNGEVLYRADFVKSSGHNFLFSTDNTNVSRSSPYANVSGSLGGHSYGYFGEVHKSIPTLNSYGGIAKTIEKSIQPMSFGSQGYLIIPGNEDVAAKRIILQFKNNQGRQALNAFEIMKSINNGKFYETNFNLATTTQCRVSDNYILGHSVSSSVKVRPGSSKDFTVRLLTDSIVEITLHPTVRQTFSHSNSFTFRNHAGDYGSGDAVLYASVNSGPTVTALLIPLSLCEISNITYYEEGVPASTSDGDVLIT